MGGASTKPGADAFGSISYLTQSEHFGDIYFSIRSNYNDAVVGSR
jgi:hypothetical protein